MSNDSRFSRAAPLPSPDTTPKPRSYPSSLTPIPSSLRPHCLARERLRLWVPLTSRSRHDHTGALIGILDSDIDRILAVISHSHMPTTRETYGSGLLVYHVFCDSHNVPEEQRCPASSTLLLAFIASCTGLYSGKTLDNYFYGI
ncbi:hypothetical protein CY34DRAFT_97327 [Suillus luteus UH-Slu-Lm8-n1]|uniref:Uncharacterized protein n=1 Tax=Suillus luteus UH-Slu-Lm8-n1 TaxID=930992 RepID=A0A0D0A9D9_9AGAM|nr:hypothetical protein CY34DRAFT_97327 [Suillus luteus UH-Slu-Lm8-n1]